MSAYMFHYQKPSAKWRLPVDSKTTLSRIVGSGNTLFERSSLQTYAADFSYHPTLKPNYVERPTGPEEVSTLIQFYDGNSISLVPCSTKNHF